MLALQKKSLLANRGEIIINSRHHTHTHKQKKGEVQNSKNLNQHKQQNTLPPQLRGVATLCPCKITLLWICT